jgi:hypothetical protein
MVFPGILTFRTDLPDGLRILKNCFLMAFLDQK